MTPIHGDIHTEKAFDIELWRTSRDRVLLYLRGLDLPPFEDLDLTAASLRSLEKQSAPDGEVDDSLAATDTPSSAHPSEAMNALFVLLDDHCSDGLLGERRIASCPPLNRGVMVAEEMDRIPWKTSIVRSLRNWRRKPSTQEGAR